MNVTQPFVLKDDVVLTPCAELSDDLRRRIDFDDGDFALSHRRGRRRSQVIDGRTAALLSLFREPRTLVDAIVESGAAGLFDELIPHLGRFVESRVLVPARSRARKAVAPRFADGATVAGWEIVRCVHVIEDSEIYEVRRGGERAALKIARVARVRKLFQNEAEALRRLDGSGIAPRLLDATRDSLLLEWIDGDDALTAAAARRHDRAALLRLCAKLAAAYAALHARGVLHGDVHPRNVMVKDNDVVLLDFGYAAHGARPVGRGGVHFFFEPERAPAPTPAGEQYALAAMLYLLIAGRHYLDFRFDREEMDRQIATAPPLPLVECREAEPILFRALEKDPARRYESVAAMARALFVEATLQSLPDAYPPPTASVYFGAAGAALALQRIGRARDAALWLERAKALIGTRHAFDDGGDVPRAMIGNVSPFHTEAAIHVVAGSVRDFLRVSRRHCEALDLTLGRSGSLLAAALLLERNDDCALRAFGRKTMAAIWDAHPSTKYSGMAHGWSGILYATLRWCEASGDAPPPRAVKRLRSFAALKILHGRGAYWPAVRGKAHHAIPGWCNGSAGPLFLFTLAHRLLGDAEWLELAELCAWTTWDEHRNKTSLCCGSAGRAYALLNFWRAGGDAAWLERARQLADHAVANAAATAQHAHSLFQGELGVAVLAAEIDAPVTARMPFFE